jgi:hypothetical protein
MMMSQDRRSEDRDREHKVRGLPGKDLGFMAKNQISGIAHSFRTQAEQGMDCAGFSRKWPFSLA